MSKLLFVFYLLVIANTASFAQDSKATEVIVARYGDSKAASGSMTREEFLANTVLTVWPLSSGCEVTSFTFGMYPKGKDYFGPFVVKGAELTREIKAKIQEREDLQGRIYIESIRVGCAGKETIVSPIILNITK